MQRAVFEDVRIEGHLIDSGIMSAGHGPASSRWAASSRRSRSRSVAPTRTPRWPSCACAPTTRSSSTRSSARSSPTARSPVDPSDAIFAPARDGRRLPGRLLLDHQHGDRRSHRGRLGARRQPRDGPRRARRPRRAALPRRSRWPTCAKATCSSSATTGIRVHPHERPRDKQAFEFMSSSVSSEKPKAQVVAEVARMLRDTRAAGRT